MRKFVGLISTTLALVGCATGGAGVGRVAGWDALESPHVRYVFGGNVDDEDALDVEYAFASLSSSPWFKRLAMPRLDVVVMSGPDFLGLFGTRRSSVTVAEVPPDGGPLGGAGVVVFAERLSSAAAVRALTPLFLTKLMPDAPYWFIEGFSLFASSLEYREGAQGRVACFGLPLEMKDSFIGLDELFNMPLDKIDTQARGWYSQTALALVDYLFFGDNGAHQEKVGPMVGGLMDGKTGPDLMAEAFPGVPLDKLRARIVEHWNTVLANPSTQRGQCPMPVPVPEDRAPAKPKWTGKADKTEVDRLLAALKRLPRREDGFVRWYPAGSLPAAPAPATPAMAPETP